MKRLKVDQKISFEGKLYRVNGFDEYRLTNIYGQTKKWISYTLIDINNEKNKIWLGYGITENFYVKMWLIPEEEFKENTVKIPLNGDYTGIANITFHGDQGYSLPVSEVIWFNLTTEQCDFFVIERFLEKDGKNIKPYTSYYHAIKILKDFTV